jgi:hypothetical protein
MAKQAEREQGSVSASIQPSLSLHCPLVAGKLLAAFPFGSPAHSSIFFFFL